MRSQGGEYDVNPGGWQGIGNAIIQLASKEMDDQKLWNEIEKRTALLWYNNSVNLNYFNHCYNCIFDAA